jgi:hypothetical protein
MKSKCGFSGMNKKTGELLSFIKLWLEASAGTYIIRVSEKLI